MADNFAMIDGQRYAVEFGGYDRATYKHEKGCLAYSELGPSFAKGPCQCGAIDRADLWYVVKVPARSAVGKSESLHDAK